MLGPAPRIPKVVTVRVKCAEGLKIIPKSESKQKKLTQKWKVHFIGGKKKMSTSSVLDTYGNPQWDYEVTFKLASKSDPVSLLVTDSEDHHVGQVLIPLVALRPRPQNPAERPTDPSRLQRVELEPTKKVANPHGTLLFWIWVEEYRSEEHDTKSTKGSLLSLTSLKHSKRASSVADSLNYSGSVISVNSSHGDAKEKKHRLFKKRSGKDLLNAAANLSNRRLSAMSGHDPSLSRSMGSVFDPTNRINLQNGGQDYPGEDHDGSILGAGSDLTGSEFYATGLVQRNSQSHSVNPSPLNLVSQQPQMSIPANRSIRRSPEPQRRISPVREDPSEQDRTLNTMQPIEGKTNKSAADTGSRPELVRLSPTSCSTAGGVEVTVHCTGLTEDMMRYASVIVDGYTVSRQDWFLQDTGRSDRSELRIHMPERPTGRCWIELETMQHGRIRCPQEFQYTAAAPASTSSTATTGSTPIISNPNVVTSEAGRSTALNRTGSQRSSLLIRDRRSTRRGRPPTVNETPVNETKEESEPNPTFNPGVETTIPEDSPLPNSFESDSPQAHQDSGIDSMKEQPSAFIRTGSQRSSIRVTDRRSMRRARPPNILPDTQKPPEPLRVQPPESPQSSDESPTAERYEASGGEAGSESTFSGEHSQMDAFQGYSARRRNSYRSEASGQSRSIVEEHSKLETETLRSMLSEANQLIETMKKQTLDLEKQLSEKSADVDRLSMELCKLRLRLLEGGATQFLEKCY